MLFVRMSLSWPLAAPAALFVLAAAHYLFWSWRLRAPPVEDELFFTRTRDGWELAIGRCRPGVRARVPPVLLLHGIAMNRQAFEFGLPRYALAAYLAGAGLDCYSLDLRGHGASRPGGPGAARRWNLDTYLAEDLPAAFEAIERRTGSAQVLVVGHSQGALLGLAAAERYPERVAGLVAMAPPIHFEKSGPLRDLVRLRLALHGPFTALSARMVAPFAGFWHPQPAQLAVNLENVEPGVYRRLLANVIENLPPGVVAQFRTFILEDSFRSMDGSIDYRAGLPFCRQPALFVAARGDGLAPPAVVSAANALWGGPKQLVVFEADYGHTDLLLGRRAPEEVYPVVREFLLAQRS